MHLIVRSFLSLTLFYATVPIAQTQQPLPALFPRDIGVAKINPEDIKASPGWSKQEENPPVSARNALLLAHQELRRFDKTIKYDRDKYRWRFHSIVLVPPSRHGNWYWLAKFDFKDVHSSGATMPEQVQIPILMNGRSVKLKVPEPQEDMDASGIPEMDAPGSP